MKYLQFLFMLLILVVTQCCVSTKSIRSENGISQILNLDIGGVEQFVLIRGENSNNPLLLLLHGGPGAAETALFRKYNADLEKDFVVVYWDQRGAGKSYNKKLTSEDITLRNYINDTHELTDYLKSRFGRQKIYLIGHSWGSRLGLYVIHEKPENYYAYIGVGQELQSFRGELQSYEYTLKRAKETENKKALTELVEMGPPTSGEYCTMYQTGFWGLVRQKHWLLKLGGERYGKTNYADWIFNIWMSREYSFGDLFKWSKGSAFSAGSMVKDPDFNNIDLFEKIPQVEIPVYFISGLFDYNTPWEIAQEYEHHVSAPKKEFILFEKSGHSPVFAEPMRFNQEVKRLFLEN